MLTNWESRRLAGEKRRRKRGRRKEEEVWMEGEDKIGETGGWSVLSEGPCKVELQFTAVTLTSTEHSVFAGPAGEMAAENCNI